MQPVGNTARLHGAELRPLSQLLACPPAVGDLLNASADLVQFESGDTIFSQSDLCRGLHVIISGQLLRKAERLNTRLTLGPVRAGELVELAAALGVSLHTYTLTAQTPGSLMLLPIATLQQAFQAHPQLRMQLLEELAREVSRAYAACFAARIAAARLRRAKISAL